jgi:hypothetical protein
MVATSDFRVRYFYNIILKGLNSIAQGKGSKVEGRQPATLGWDEEKKNTLKGLHN